MATGVILVAVALVLADQPPAGACSCAADPPPTQALARAGAVFAGTVVGTRTVGRGVGEDLVARVAVEEVWKGDVAETVDVSTPVDGAMCGVGFGPGDRWLIYASGGDGGFGTHACTRTAPLAYGDEDRPDPGIADEDLQAFGAGGDPLRGEQLRSEPLPWRAIMVAAAVALGVLVVWYARVAGGPDTAEP